MVILLLISVLACGSFATDFKVNGVYTAWGQSQHAFTFNKDSYDDNYVVQMLRFKVQGIANENLKFVTRLDIAQGWWGVDNSLRTVERWGKSYTNKFGGSNLFDFKDTNFLVHVDQAYVDFNIPKTSIGARVGRMWYGLGNKIMVDNNYDGIQIDVKNLGGGKLTAGWAKVSEGVDGLRDKADYNPVDSSYTDSRDAHLFTLNFHNKAGGFSYDAYGMYYKDASILDNDAYVPDHLQFFKTRFSPQVTQLTAVGVSGSYKSGKLKVNGEVDYLTGKDDINNSTFGAKQMLDKNDGDLSGYNLYLKANYAAADKLDVGAVFGMGSGDDDLTGGKGNVNKLRTSGFFYITEVWEDSIMPDEEGITPQGLGAPNVRGYRELENTTIFQVNGTLKPCKKLSAFLSYSYIKATQAVHAWSVVKDQNGNVIDAAIDHNTSATDLGQEIDFRINYKMFKEFALILRGGYFMPGDAAGYLIVGHNKDLDPAWEAKAIVLYKF